MNAAPPPLPPPSTFKEGIPKSGFDASAPPPCGIWNGFNKNLLWGKNKEFDEEELDSEEFEEYSSMAGGSVEGYTGPLGAEKMKAYIEEQYDYMRRLERYHRKTTSNIK